MINIAKLKEEGKRPRVHGNGFIQLDLTDHSCLHIWGDPRIPRQSVPTMIHDHAFGFESTIILGRLINVIYHFREYALGNFRIHVPEIREGEDTILKPTDTRGDVHPIHTDMIDYDRMGLQSYTMQPFDFHETVAPDGPAATIITKDGLTQAQGAKKLPRVLVPVDKQPDNGFNRYAASEDLLWKIIEDTLKLRRG